MILEDDEERITFVKDFSKNHQIMRENDVEMEEENGHMSSDEESKHQSNQNNSSEQRETRWSKENDKNLYATYRNK